MSDSEKLYTLQEAETWIERVECADDFHRPSIVMGTYTDRFMMWRCECGDVTYKPMPKIATEDVGE